MKNDSSDTPKHLTADEVADKIHEVHKCMSQNRQRFEKEAHLMCEFAGREYEVTSITEEITDWFCVWTKPEDGYGRIIYMPVAKAAFAIVFEGGEPMPTPREMGFKAMLESDTPARKNPRAKLRK